MPEGGSNLGRAVLQLVANGKQLSKDLAIAEKKSVDRAKKIGKEMTKYLTTAVIAIGGAVLKAADTIDEALKTIRTGTGKTGKELDDLKKDFDAVFKATPKDAQAAAQAIADFNTELGLTGQELQKASIAAVEAGIDIGGLGRAMAVFKEDASRALPLMDRFFVIAQETNLPINALIGQLQTYGPVMRNAGLETEETAALFGNLHAAGVDVSRVMPGINAFMRRTAAEGVTDLKGALLDIVEQVHTATTDAEALNVATTAFGSEGAQRMSVAIRNGAFELDNLIGKMNDAAGAIATNTKETRTLSDDLKIMKNRVTSLLAGFSDLPQPLRFAAIGLGGVAAAAGPVLLAMPSMVSGAKLVSGAAKGLATSLGSGAGALGGILGSLPGRVTAAGGGLKGLGVVARGLATGPIGLLTAGIAAAGGLIFALIKLRKSTPSIREQLDDVHRSMYDLREITGRTTAAIDDELHRAIQEAGDRAEDAAPKVSDLAESLHEIGGAIEEAQRSLDAMDSKSLRENIAETEQTIARLEDSVRRWEQSDPHGPRADEFRLQLSEARTHLLNLQSALENTVPAEAYETAAARIIEITQELNRAEREHHITLSAQQNLIRERQAQFDTLKDAAIELGEEEQALAFIQKTLGEATVDVAEATEELTTATNEQTAATQAYSESLQDVKDRVSDYYASQRVANAEVEAYLVGGAEAVETSENVARALDGVSDSAKGAAERVREYYNQQRPEFVNTLELFGSSEGAVSLGELEQAIEDRNEALASGQSILQEYRESLEDTGDAEITVAQASASHTQNLEAQRLAAENLLSLQQETTASIEDITAATEALADANATAALSSSALSASMQQEAEALASGQSILQEYRESLEDTGDAEITVAQASATHTQNLEAQRLAAENLLSLQQETTASIEDITAATEALADANATAALSSSALSAAMQKEAEALARIKEAQTKYRDDLFDLEEQYLADIGKLNDDETEALANAQDKFRSDHLDAKRKLDRQLTDLSRQSARDRERAEQDHLDRMTDIRRQAAQSELDAETDRNCSIGDINQDFERNVQDLRRRLGEDFFGTPDADITGILSQVGADTKLLEAHLEGMAELTLKRDRALEDVQTKHNRTLADMETERRRKEEEAQWLHTQKLEEIGTQHRFKVSAAHREYSRQESALIALHNAEIATIESRLETVRVDRLTRFTEDQVQLWDSLWDSLNAIPGERTPELEAAMDSALSALDPIIKRWGSTAASRLSSILDNATYRTQQAAQTTSRPAVPFQVVGGPSSAVLPGSRTAPDTGPGYTMTEGFVPRGRPLSPMDQLRIPPLPGLAAGGLVLEPMVAALGEAGPEAVMPLENLVDFSRGDKVQVNVTLGAEMRKMGVFVREQVLEGNLKGSQEQYRLRR